MGGQSRGIGRGRSLALPARIDAMDTKIKNCRLTGSDHDTDCKIDGFGAMRLTAEFVRQV